MPSFISEDDIEQALIAKLREKWSETYNFETLNCFTLADRRRLKRPLRPLRQTGCHSRRSSSRRRQASDSNRSIPMGQTSPIPPSTMPSPSSPADDSAMSMIAANRELDSLIRDGIEVKFDGPDGKNRNRARSPNRL